MTIFRFLLSASLFGMLTVAACGDHLTVPPDKTGACVKGLLTKCGTDCVDLQTSLTSCGKCGTACNVAMGEICTGGKCTAACPTGSMRCNNACVDTNVDRLNCGMCGKTCAMNEVCAKGTCAASCEAAGYATCMGATTTVDAGGATSCVDLKSENGNCGSCGNVCAGMLSCTNGVCCIAGQIGCKGQCLDAQADSQNCGGCGIVCPMNAPNCVAGACSSCDPDILILSDNQTTNNKNMATAFQNRGFRATVIDSGGSTYAGMPAIAGFGAVVVMPATQHTTDMPMAGQQAIATAQGSGTGVVLEGWTSYAIQQGRLQTIKPLALLTYTNTTAPYTSVNVSVGGLPFSFNTPGAFGQVNTTQWFGCTLINNGMQAGSYVYNQSWPAAAYRASPNGRIVHLSYGINHPAPSSHWTNDANMTQWVVNAVRYAAKCTN